VLTTHTKSKNIRDLYQQINKFKRGYQPRTNLLKDENGNVLAYSHKVKVKSKAIPITGHAGP
jgi:hypothetical protein